MINIQVKDKIIMAMVEAFRYILYLGKKNLLKEAEHLYYTFDNLKNIAVCVDYNIKMIYPSIPV